MRNYQTFRSLEVLRVKSSKIGKIALLILITIITLLAYNQVEAKENKDLFREKTFFEELQENPEFQQYDLSESKDSIRKNQQAFAELIEEKNDLERVIYSINSLYPTKKMTLDLERAEEKVAQKNVDPELREAVAKELSGTKMEAMIDPIASFDRETAALIVGIAKIESGYSHNYSYNFWGYAGGYYGFANPEEAVDVVGSHIEKLKNQGLDTPSKIVTTWKCGNSCATHSSSSVARWVATVSGPYGRIALAI